MSVLQTGDLHFLLFLIDIGRFEPSTLLMSYQSREGVKVNSARVAGGTPVPLDLFVSEAE